MGLPGVSRNTQCSDTGPASTPSMRNRPSSSVAAVIGSPLWRTVRSAGRSACPTIWRTSPSSLTSKDSSPASDSKVDRAGETGAAGAGGLQRAVLGESRELGVDGQPGQRRPRGVQDGVGNRVHLGEDVAHLGEQPPVGGVEVSV